jgi:hypothetical protein
MDQKVFLNQSKLVEEVTKYPPDVLRKFDIQPTSCLIKSGENISDNELQRVLEYFLAVNDATAWAIGDLILEMESRGLESVVNEVCNLLGKSYSHISAHRRVCSRVPVEKRRLNISFTAYVEIFASKLSPNDQDEILNETISGGLPVKRIRALIQNRLHPKNISIDYKSTLPNDYGEPTGFDLFPHAPTNEQGVVFLFGILSKTLGYVVEHVRTKCPDCIAKKIVNLNARRGRRMETVRIEFEFKSSNFLSHYHDFETTDVIVCWEHDWKECPSKFHVVELKSELSRVVSKNKL